jgi:FkbM family methyltransferase
LRHVSAGRYIDIGAQDPIVDSVSLAFYERGWRGVHVEPDPAYAAQLRQARPDETVIQAAVNTGGGTITLFEIPGTGLSTGVPAIAEEHRQQGFDVRRIDVPSIPLSQVLGTFAGEEVHWLKIDVEGMESEVIESWAQSAVRPWIVAVESTYPQTSAPSFAAWEDRLTGLGYDLVYRDGLNRFYLSHGHPELRGHFEVPPNVFDNFSLSGRASSTICHHVLGEAAAERKVLQDRIAMAESCNAALRQRITSLQEQVTSSEDELSKARRRIDLIETHLRQTMDRAREAEAGLAEARHAAAQTQAKFNDALRQIDHRDQLLIEARSEIRQIYASRSWRLTNGPRVAAARLRWVRDGSHAWVTLTPGSRPRRIAQGLVHSLSHWVRQDPRRRALAVRVLGHMPSVQRKLSEMLRSSRTSAAMSASFPEAAGLSARAQQIHRWIHS